MEGAEGSGGKWGLAQAPQPAAGLVPAFSFLPQQLAPSGRHRTLVWAPAEVRQGEEKKEENMLGFFSFIIKSNNASKGKWE